MKIQAIHRIRLGGSKGKFVDVQPGQQTDVSKETGAELVAAGAAVEIQPTVTAPVDPGAGDGSGAGAGGAGGSTGDNGTGGTQLV